MARIGCSFEASLGFAPLVIFSQTILIVFRGGKFRFNLATFVDEWLNRSLGGRKLARISRGLQLALARWSTSGNRRNDGHYSGGWKTPLITSRWAVRYPPDLPGAVVCGSPKLPSHLLGEDRCDYAVRCFSPLSTPHFVCCFASASSHGSGGWKSSGEGGRRRERRGRSRWGGGRTLQRREAKRKCTRKGGRFGRNDGWQGKFGNAAGGGGGSNDRKRVREEIQRRQGQREPKPPSVTKEERGRSWMRFEWQSRKANLTFISGILGFTP